MNVLKITSTFILFFTFFSTVLAQVNGNGKMKTISLEADDLTKLYADFPIKLILDNSGGEQLEMTADENVFKFIGIRRSGNKLNITQEQWIEPTKMVEIKGSLSKLVWLKMTGYGFAEIQNINAENTDCFAQV